MSGNKFNGELFKFRKVTDLKDLLTTSIQEYADQTAYLVKDRELGEFVPISYGKVGKDLRALGTKFMEMGLADQKIAVIGETRYEWLLTYFAAVSGVGVIVPLDRNLPEGELCGLMERSGAAAIVYSGKMEETIGKIRSRDNGAVRYYIDMDAEEHTADTLSFRHLIQEGDELVQGGSRIYLDRDVDPDQMSTLLFTSGTTGMAKGVMISHRNIASNVYAMSKYFRIPEPGIVLSILPVHHVYEMTCDIWTTFYQGKTIAICEGIRYIQKNMAETHANVMLGVPLVFEKMYKGMWKQAKRRGEAEKLRRAIDLSKRLKLYRNKAVVRRMFRTIHKSFGGDMQVFVAGGAAADPHVIDEFTAMGLPVIQGYGMTECSPIVALNPMDASKTGSVGLPLPGSKVRVINQDEDGIGEVIVKSDSVMMGYYENEEANAETLQNGWLHTGDLGYFDRDGYLYLTGRSKTVIVTKGGKNIFPEEVEDVLLKDERIKEVLVHGVQDERVGNVIITADIFPDYALLKEQKGEMSRSDIYHFYKDLVDSINENMPPYKQVKRINIRETEFVKTTTGKIKRYGNVMRSQISDAGSLNVVDKKKLDLRSARDLISRIRESQDPSVQYRDQWPAGSVKDLLNGSEERYRGKGAFLQKFHPEGAFVEMTYQQARADLEGLGTALMNRGVYQKKVALIGRNSYQWQITYLTVMTGVGTVVPMDGQLDPEELARELAVTGADVIVYDERYEEKVREILETGAPVSMRIRWGVEDEEHFFESGSDTPVENPDGTLSWHSLLAEGKDQASQGDRQFLDAEVTGDDQAAIFFTSGAAGKHKAVPLTHRNLVSNVIQLSSVIGMGEEDTIFSVIPPNNVYQCNMGLLLPLYRGAEVANSEGSDRLRSNLEDVKPTILLAEPVMIRELYDITRSHAEDNAGLIPFRSRRMVSRATKFVGIDLLHGVAKNARKRLGGRMRLMISGGGALDQEIVSFFDLMGIAVAQGYGMTEASSAVAAGPDQVKMQKPNAAGYLLPGTGLKIVNRDRGGIGEILVKGPGIMAGYQGDPEETKRVLRDGWFHTGDLGYIDDDNFVYLTGRKER